MTSTGARAETSGLVAASPGAWLAPEYSPGLVSVVIPVHNRAALLTETLASVRAQTWRPLEILVVDDGSTEDLRVNAPLDPQQWTPSGIELHLLRQEHKGVAAARNAGARHSRGEFLYYLDSDDLVFPESIARFVTALRTSGAAYAYAPIGVADEHGDPIPGDRRWYPRAEDSHRFFDCEWLVHGALYRRSVVLRAGPWNEDLHRGEDSEFLWRVKALNEKGQRLTEVQGIYRLHSSAQLSVRDDVADICDDTVAAMDGFVLWLRRTDRLAPVLRRAIVRKYALLGLRLGIMGRMAAKDRAFEAIRRLGPGRMEWERLLVPGGRVASPRVFEFLRTLRDAVVSMRALIARH